MAKKPLLRWRACHRGRDMDILRSQCLDGRFEFLNSASLMSCMRDPCKPKAIYKFGRSCVLEFAIVIRPGGYPEELRGG